MAWGSITRLSCSKCYGFFLLVGLSLCLQGCLNSPLPPEEASLSATVHLQGSDNFEGVEVILPGTSYRGFSDRDGKVIFDHLPPRSYELLARKEGFLEYRERKISLEKGDHIDLGVIQLTAIPTSGRIEGRVSVEGIPGATAEIRLLGSSIAPIVSATDGFFGFPKVPPGHYRVSIDYPHFTAGDPLSVTIEAGNIANLGLVVLKKAPDATPTPTPAAGTPSATATLVVTEPQPQPTPKDVVAPDSPAIIRGFAFYPDRQDHSGIVVRVVDPPREAVTDASGAFLISDVPPGARTLRAEAEGFAPEEITDLQIIPGELTTAPKIQLSVDTSAEEESATAMVYGQIYLKDKGPQPGTMVVLEGTGLSTVTGGDGTFLFNDVGPGEYTLLATRDQYETVEVDVEVTETGEDVPVPVIQMEPEEVYLQVVQADPAPDSRKVAVTDRVEIRIRFNERFIPNMVNTAVSVSPRVACKIESPEADLIAVDLLRAEKPPVEFDFKYTVTVSTSLQSVEGHHLEEPYVLRFTTGGPRILSSIPTSGAKDVLLFPGQSIFVDFNQSVDIRQLAERIKISPRVGEVPVLTQRHLPFGQRVEIQLPVNPNRRYKITIPSNVRTESDDRRYENTPYTISFRTGDYDNLPDAAAEDFNNIEDLIPR